MFEALLVIIIIICNRQHRFPCSYSLLCFQGLLYKGSLPRYGSNIRKACPFLQHSEEMGRQFKQDRESLEDNPYPGRPVSITRWDISISLIPSPYINSHKGGVATAKMSPALPVQAFSSCTLNPQPTKSLFSIHLFLITSLVVSPLPSPPSILPS